MLITVSGSSKVAIGVNVSGLFHFCVSLGIDWRPAQGVPHHSPNIQLPHNLQWIRGIDTRWMDGVPEIALYIYVYIEHY